MMLLGAHISIAGSLALAPARGREIGCSAIQIFTKNQLQWQAKPLADWEIRKFQQAMASFSIQSIVAHDSYLINLASPDEHLLAKSRQAFLDEMDRAESLGIPFLIFHPGSHKNAGEAVGLNQIVASIDYVNRQRPAYRLKLLLETTAGQGTNLGYSFEQLQWIIEKTEQPDRVGVCLDTCHIFAAGYDLRDQARYQKTLEEFDQIIGLEKLQAIHLNDSKEALGSRVDRHEQIGSGQIGLVAFESIMKDSRLAHVPKILEIPGDSMVFKANLDLLKSLVES